jgi:hypothetical protein
VSRRWLEKFFAAPANVRASLSAATLLLVWFLLTPGPTILAQQSTPAKPSEYEQAKELYERGDNAGAIEILQKVVRARRGVTGTVVLRAVF